MVTQAKNVQHYNTEGILVRDVSSTLYKVNRESAPFQTFTRTVGRHTQAKSTKIEWYKSVLNPTIDAINNGAGYNDALLTFAVDNPKYFKAGNVIVIPRTGEQMRVASVDIAGLTITVGARAWGVTTAAALVDDDPILILSQAEAERGVVPAIRSTALEGAYNYTQIFKTPWGLSGTARAVGQAGGTYGGNNQMIQREGRAIEHLRAIELQSLFGEMKEDTSGDDPIRAMGGLRQFISENVWNVNGVMTEPGWKSWLRGVFREARGSGSRFVLADPLICEGVSYWAQSKVQTTVDTKKYGMAVKYYFTDFGTVVMRPHWLLTAEYGYGGWMFAIDPEQIEYRALPGRDTHIQYNVQNPGEDQVIDQFLTEQSISIALPEVHGKAYGATGYS